MTSTTFGIHHGTHPSNSNSTPASQAIQLHLWSGSWQIQALASLQRLPCAGFTQERNWSVLQCATMEGLLAWSKTLPPDICPHRVTLQAGSGEHLFDALAEP